MRPRRERDLHRIEVDAVGRRVQQDVGAVQRGDRLATVADVERAGRRPAAAVPLGNLPRPGLVDVEDQDALDALVLGQRRNDGRADDAGRADDRDGTRCVKRRRPAGRPTSSSRPTHRRERCRARRG